ncbi:MAG: S41 family peptidase [Candidatus Sumerlaeota bacterium]
MRDPRTLRFFATLFLGLLLCQSGRSSAQESAATTPHVVETTPTLNQCGVSPDLSTIEVRFDRPMARGSWSWCGGGTHYPELSGKPFYRDDFTCVLPVKLRPQTTYFLGVNCPSGQHFRSADGVPAEALQLAFITGSGTTNVMARMDNYKSWEALTSQFTAIYSYYERTGTDWKKVFNEVMPCVMESPSVEEFVMRAVMVLGNADDPHLAMKMPDGTRIRTHKHFGFYNANQKVIESTFPGMKKNNDLVWSAKRDDIGYIAVHGWDNQKQFMDAIDPIMADMTASTHCLIVDVRGNGGGVENEGMKLAGWFLDHDVMYAKNRYRDKSSADGWTPMRERWVRANPPAKRFHGKVFMLQGSVCLSSNEAFIEMMNQSPLVTSIGATTGGSSANPRSYDLPNGAKIVLPRWESYSVDSVLLEGRGIPAKIPIDGDFMNADPVLEKAMDLAADDIKSKGVTTESTDK